MLPAYVYKMLNQPMVRSVIRGAGAQIGALWFDRKRKFGPLHECLNSELENVMVS